MEVVDSVLFTFAVLPSTIVLEEYIIDWYGTKSPGTRGKVESREVFASEMLLPAQFWVFPVIVNLV